MASSQWRQISTIVDGLDRADWPARIDGIVGFEPCLTPAHKHAYDNVHCSWFRINRAAATGR